MPRYRQTVLVSCEIPWSPQQEFMEGTFRDEVRLVRSLGFNDVYVFGTAGEGHAVTDAQFRSITAAFRDATADSAARPMVGVIGLSSGIVIERLAIAHALGFRRFQISLPSWGALNDRELLTFFRDVCGAFPDSEFLHYNLARAKRVLNGQDYRRIADAVPNLVATKNCLGGAKNADDLMTHASDLQHFFGEQEFAHGALHGECSILGTMAAVAPNATKAYLRAGQRRDREQLFELQHLFDALVHGIFGDLLHSGRIDSAFDKILKRLGGFESMPLQLLSPYEAFTEAEYQECRERFSQLRAQYPQAR